MLTHHFLYSCILQSRVISLLGKACLFILVRIAGRVMVTSVVLYLDYVIHFFLPFMLFAQALLHLFLMHHMAQIMSYCRTPDFYFFLCWCRESLIEYTCWNGTLFCRWNRPIACSCLLRVLGRIHSTVWFLHFSKRWWWECFTCPLMHEINRVNMTAGFNVTSCSQLLHWKR